MSKRDAYIQKLESQYDEWDAKIRELKAKAEGAEADARVEYHKQIESLQQKQKDAKAKLDELRSASEDAWEDLKAGAESAWASLKDAVESATSRIR